MGKQKTILLMLLTIFFVSTLSVYGQEKDWPAPSKFFNIGFAYTTLKQDGNPDLKSDFGISISKATTYYLHKPIAGRLRFGIEAVWGDVTYSNYKVNYISMLDSDKDRKETIHTIEATMQVGLGINFNITSKSSLHGYFRYAPGFSALYNGDNFTGGFLNGALGGLLINYRKIGAGIEWRFGTSKHKKLLSDLFDNQEPVDSDTDSKIKTKMNGMRAYITFTF